MLEEEEIIIQGAPISRGIAIGFPFFFTLVERDVPEFAISHQDVPGEITRYQNAVEKSRDDIRQIQKKLQKDEAVEGVAILEAYLQMMKDPLITTQVEREIGTRRKNAEFVFTTTLKSYQKKFNSIADPFFRERFKDIQDISRRVLGYLFQTVRISLADTPENSIIFASDLVASDTAEVSIDKVGAFVTEEGGSTSHAAIVAKAKGIPYVTNIDFSLLVRVNKEKMVIVDGRTGKVILNPREETLSHYRELQQKLSFQMRKLGCNKELEAETADGHKVRLLANIESPEEVNLVHQYGGNGVGLFRSEYIFLSEERFPTEEEQLTIYKNLVSSMNGLPIVIRTFDVGGDKVIYSQQKSREENPFLGCRAIRFLLKEREIFKDQLRAILRASMFGDVRILFPMIATLPELLEAKRVIKEVEEELTAKNVPYAEKIPLGCMIEVPSAAIIADLLAEECDFLSIGTNDLVQYALAVDRDNQAISGLYTPSHPSVIRFMQMVISEAHAHKISVSICGEVAADPRFTALLIGLGVQELSVAPRYIPTVKRAIRSTSLTEANRLAQEVLQLHSAAEILDLLKKEYAESIPEDSFYPSIPGS